MTTQSGLLALQKGILNYLSAQTSVQGVIGDPARIYDVPPPNPTFPFILIGEMTSEEWGARDSGGQKVELSVQSFANINRGSADIKNIGDIVRAALDNQEANISLAAGKIMLCIFEGHSDELTKDGVAWMGTTKFTIYLET